MRSSHLTALAVVYLALALVACRPGLPPAHYTTALTWRSHDAGLALAKAQHRPVMVTLHADWCEPCRAFARLLDDPNVIIAAWDFVVIAVDVDREPELARRYAVDGNYLPRTFFLTSDGVLMKGIPAPRLWFKLAHRYGYNHTDPRPLVAALEKAEQLAAGARDGEDPSALTASEVCSAKAEASACTACVHEKCCDPLVSCLNDAACGCRLISETTLGNASTVATCGPTNALHRATLACFTDRCAAACPAGPRSL